jgi:TatD DNase family protein
VTLTEFVDTHCHLDFDTFENDRQTVLERAQDSGIVKILNPGIDIVSSREAVSLAEKHAAVYAAVGIHPNDALSWNTNSVRELEELAKHPKVVAMGEIGLDYYRERAPHELQQKIFIQQLTLAAELELPVVIHNREATADILRILVDWRSELSRSQPDLAQNPGVLHSYSGDLLSADIAISLGFKIGFTGPITYKNADGLRQVAASLPLESILIETDAPFLTPQPKRGSRNEPSYVKYVAEKLAELHNLDLETTAQATYANAEKLLKW